jgi:hypothetical protein
MFFLGQIGVGERRFRETDKPILDHCVYPVPNLLLTARKLIAGLTRTGETPAVTRSARPEETAPKRSSF